jgi:glutamate receptor, ionotropic, invertebrate
MASDNRTRLIVTIFEEPMMMLKKEQNGNLSEDNILSGTILDPSQVEGYYADLTYAIFEEKLKIPYKFIIEKKYGMQIEKGVWIGMVGALVNRVADAAIASLTINVARAKVVDFSHPFVQSGISLMMQKPGTQKQVLLYTFLSSNY